jgi:glycosyltransferase involved in cell wall biosynthesis
MNRDRANFIPIADKRPRVVFVGAFVAMRALRGGQLSACRSLMLTDFSRVLDVVTIDSTQSSVPPPSFPRRLCAAAVRFGRFNAALARHRPTAVLIFLADGTSFVEKGLLAMIARSLGIRTVIAPRSGFLLDDYQRSRLMRIMIRRVLRSVDVIVCQSEFWASTFSSWGTNPDKCVVLKNWIDAQPFASIGEPANLQSPLQLLFLGWVDEHKGIFELLQAIGALRGEGRDVRLTVAGEGKDLARARVTSAQLHIDDAVSFVGWVDDEAKLGLLEQCHILVLPSHREGLPNAMLEGMAAGRAIVASSVGSIPDVLAGSGAGLLHAPRDVTALVAAIRSYDDDRAALAGAGRKGRMQIARDHSLEAAWQRLYRCLVGR